MKLLLLNPKRKSTVKKGAVMKRRKAHKAVAKRRSVRRRNPIAVSTVSAPRRKRRSLRRIGAVVARSVGRRIKRRVGALRSRMGGGSVVTQAKHTLMNGAVAGLGAVGADMVAAQLMRFLPTSVQTGPAQQIAQALVSVAAGFAISKVNKTAGEAVAMGGVTVATYNLTKNLLKGAGVPGMAGYYNLAGYDYDPSYGMEQYDPLKSVNSTNVLAGYVPTSPIDSGAYDPLMSGYVNY